MSQEHPSRTLIIVVVIALIVVAMLSVGFLSRSSVRQTATVQFFSNNAQGYACFLNYASLAPVCMSDDPSTMLPPKVTLPLGNYSIVFFPFNTASNKSTWYGTNSVHVIGWAPYDASSSYANVTITGDGALVVFVVPENGVAITEFPGITAVPFVALAASLLLVRRRRR
jgi:hypothetical protein